MLDAKLNEYCVDCSDLHAISSAGVAYFGCLDMVGTVGLKEGKRREALNQLTSCFRTCKALKQFLQDKACREDLVRAFKSMLQSLHFSKICGRVAAKRQ